MTPDTRRIWEEVITAEDLDAHMESIGQADANAKITREMFADFPISMGRILIPGCGTGQLFRLIGDIGEVFGYSTLVLNDVNEDFLGKAYDTCLSAGHTDAEPVKGAIEETDFEPCNGALMVLVLEHIDWKKGLESVLKTGARNLYIIIQEQDIAATIVTTRKKLRPSIAKFIKVAHPQLIPREELTNFLAEQGYSCRKTYEREVQDGKKMIGMVFTTSAKT